MTLCPIENPHFCLGARCQITGICDFNRRFAAAQKPLGPEAAKVLYDNLPDLYLRVNGEPEPLTGSDQFPS